jgi:hypothetical protein
VPLTKRNCAHLCGDEAILHRVRDLHAHIQADDARGPFQRVRGAHADLELICGGGIALQSQQAAGQCLDLAFGVEPEQLVHRHFA